MMKENRIKYFAPADYSEGTDIDILLKAIIDRTVVNEHLEEIHFRNLKTQNANIIYYKLFTGEVSLWYTTVHMREINMFFWLRKCQDHSWSGKRKKDPAQLVLDDMPEEYRDKLKKCCKR